MDEMKGPILSRDVGEWVDMFDEESGRLMGQVQFCGMHGRRAKLFFRGVKSLRFVRREVGEPTSQPVPAA